MSSTDLLLLFALIVGAIAILAGIAVLGIAAISAHRVVRPPRAWQPEGWTAPALPLERVFFANPAGQRLHGWYVPPAPGGAVALICHGFGTNRREAQDVIPWLTAEGYGVLLFDFQAHGESEGRYTTVGLREVDDLLAAVRYVKQREGEATPIVGLGISMGASVMIMAAARTDAIRALFLDSPFATLQRAVSRAFRVFFGLPPRVFTRPTIWFAERFAGGRVGDVQPIQSIPLIAPRPVFIVQGTEDRIVDPEDSLLLYEAAGEPKSLWRIPGADHVQARTLFPEEYRARLLETFTTGLRSAVPEPAALRA